MFQGLRTLIFSVPDLQAAKTWYQEVLADAPYFDQSFYVGFNVGGYELGLVPDEGEVIRGSSVYCYWGVADIQQAFARLLKLGASEFEAIQDVGEGIQTASLKDPWGNVFGIIYNPHFKLPT
jgi:lactoylglutathione lyase